MTPAQTIYVGNLPDHHISNRSPLFMGQVIMCAIEGAVLLMLCATYLYLRFSVDVWPSPGTRMPANWLPTLELLPLLLSCVGSYKASEAAKKNDKRGMILGLGVNLALGVLAMSIRFFVWKGMNFNWASDAHGSIVWSMLFIHTLDVIADLLMTTVLLLIVVLGRAGPKQRIGVHVDSVIWYFLVAVWLPMYILIFWGPYLIGSWR